MRTVLFYTRPCYIDAALEYIKLAQHQVNLHVVIQMSVSELKSNIFNLDVDLTQYQRLTAFEEVAEEWGIKYLHPFFKKCRSVSFLIYQTEGLKHALLTSLTLLRFVQKIKPDYLHFDDLTGKQFILYPALWPKRSRVILNIHDPKPHSGEYSAKKYYIQNLLYKLPAKAVVFSQFSRHLLKERLGKTATSIHTLYLLPYTVFKHFNNHQEANGKYISFIGRLSPYKGIHLFIDAMREVIERYPSQQFLIAGKTVFGHPLNQHQLVELSHNLTVVEKHLSNQEMVSFINESELIVCPYLDATQSGVILTAFAMHRPVLVTRVGGLPEYVSNGVNGLICDELTPNALANKICDFLKASGSEFQKSVFEDSTQSWRDQNLIVIKNLYS